MSKRKCKKWKKRCQAETERADVAEIKLDKALPTLWRKTTAYKIRGGEC